ncbi:DUF1980 domain-containing protein [Cohnella caldifontis]|uniref:DUF1980 domain-containing protein n=1 Tax=Cohnella caldifontis TaxID=3027471 RepID=UPI0023EDABB0|nr:DUF1980 domain-containing protein [Cohnella sp. YIM B05605]
MDRYRIRMAHHAIRALILGGLSFYLIRLARTGGLPSYVEPGMVPYVKLAALGFVVMAVVQAAQAMFVRGERRDTLACGCPLPRETSSWKGFAPYGLFLLPLLWGLLNLPSSSPPIPVNEHRPAETEDGLWDLDPAGWAPAFGYAEPDADFGFGE